MRNTRRGQVFKSETGGTSKDDPNELCFDPKTEKKKTFDNSAAATAAAVVNAAATCSRDRLHLQLTRSRRAASYFG